MNQIERRALYNLLRMNWLNDRSLLVEPWQVEDYRQLTLDDLFERLKKLSIQLDKASFVIYANECDSPEDLTDYLIGDHLVKPNIEDQVYLLVFELWRRLMGEKPSLSVFCDELDHQIYAYDQGKMEQLLTLQDALANLLTILDENVDEGIKPKEAFELISACCANDLETFLYDFISEQIDAENESYAQEILDNFAPYFADNKWFTFLRARVLGLSSTKTANKLLSQIMEDHLESQDLEFNLEVLTSMTEIGTPQLFSTLAKHTIPLLSTEEDFQDLLHICAEYYHRLDQEQREKVIQDILNQRAQQVLNQSFNAKDQHVLALIKILEI